MNEANRLRELEPKNAKLKKPLAEKLLDGETMNDVLSKKVVKSACEKPVTAHLVNRHRLSERTACHLVGLSRTAYRDLAKPKDYQVLRERLTALAVEHTRYGYLLLHGMLKAEGLVVNKKRT